MTVRRVLHVNDYASGGGCELVVRHTMSLLQDRGVETALWTSADVPGHRRTPWSYIANRRAAHAIIARVRDWKPDVVHVHNMYHELSPSVLAALARARSERAFRLVMTVHDSQLICPNAGLTCWRNGQPVAVTPEQVRPLRGVLFRRWDHRGLGYSLLKIMQHVLHYRVLRRRQLVDVFACPSRFVQRPLVALGLPAIVLTHPSPAPVPLAQRPADQLRLVFAGRIEPEKGLWRFLEAIPAPPAFQLDVYGDGSERAACEAIIRRRQIESLVTFHGEVPHADAQRAIAAAHVLVLPSRCADNAPGVLLEALASGTNVAASDRGGIGEIVADAGVGFLFDPDDPASIDQTMHEIVHAWQHGSLNRFECDAFLARRSEDVFIDGLLAVYHDTFDE